MKKQILSDVRIECETPYHVGRWCSTVERKAEELEDWVKDFKDFIRDHRSQDPVNLSVERVYTDVCSFCGATWEVDDDGCPVCCDAAVKEWDEAKAAKAVEQTSHA